VLKEEQELLEEEQELLEGEQELLDDEVHLVHLHFQSKFAICADP
jgi:hypothetical protein